MKIWILLHVGVRVGHIVHVVVPGAAPVFYVHIKREGYDEERYKEVGRTYSVNDTQTIQCAIIDKSICWYGDVNFLGYHAADNTVMRIADAKVAGELLDMMSNK